VRSIREVENEKIVVWINIDGKFIISRVHNNSNKRSGAPMNETANILDLQDTKIHIIAAGDIDEFLKREDIGIIDARTKEEFDGGTLDDRAVLVEIKKGDELEGSLEKFKIEINKLNKDKTWFIYCGSGMRSNKGAEVMVENGFKDVYELKGGLKEYESQK